MDKSADLGAPSLYDEMVSGSAGLSNESAADGDLLDAQRVVLRAERARMLTRTVEGRRAVISRRVVSLRKIIEVDVLHEELHIEYLPGDGRELQAGDQPESIVVRLHAEEVEIVKRVRVVEEVLLSKKRVARTVPVEVSLQHEELDLLHIDAEIARSSERRSPAG